MSKKKRLPTKRRRNDSFPKNAIYIRGGGVDTDILDKDLAKLREHQDGIYYSNADLIQDKWVMFFGNSGSFLKDMMSLIDNSVTLRNVINQKSTLVMGDGFAAVTRERAPLLAAIRKLIFPISATQIEELNDQIALVNAHGESLEDVIRKVVWDFDAFGNAVVYFKKTEDPMQPLVFYHAPLETVGVHKVVDGVIPSIGICADWDAVGLDDSVITEIPMYPEFSSTGMSAIHIKNYAPNHFYWGLPNWVAARKWAEIEYRIASYNISQFANGFMPSAFLEIYGNPDPNTLREFVNSLKEKYMGTGNNSQLLVQVTPDPEMASKLHILEDKSEGKFESLQELATRNIITAGQFMTSLSGIAQSGKLGTNQQMEQELEYMNNTIIANIRRVIEQKVLLPYTRELGKALPNLAGSTITLIASSPISMASKLKPETVLTVNEQREILGYPALEEDQAQDNQEE